MPASLWVSMPILRNIVIAAARDEHDIRIMCKAGGITTDQLEDAAYKASLEQNCAIMEAALAISADPFLGLHIGEKTTASVLGITGHLMQSSRDALTALQHLQAFTETFTRLYTFRTEIKDAEVFLYCEPLEVWNDISPATARHSVDIAFAGSIHILKLLTSRHFQPRQVLYRYVRLTDTSEHERILKCKPRFNQGCNGIVFSYDDLLFPVIGYNKELSNTFTNLLNEVLQKDLHGAGFVAEVKRVILQNFQFRFPSLEDIAGSMHITVRTLQRRLQEEGTSFRELSDMIKQELASQLLRNKQLPVAEIAYKLGYAEASSFQRAFRQWTGKTPLEYRNER